MRNETKQSPADSRESVTITKTKQVGDMVFTKGEEWLVNSELKQLMIDNGVI